MWQLDDLDNKEEVQGALVIKGFYQYKWPTFHSSHYCIVAMKQYNCVAKIQITLYCNVARHNLFARYVLYHHKYIDYILLVPCCFDAFTL